MLLRAPLFVMQPLHEQPVLLLLSLVSTLFCISLIMACSLHTSLFFYTPLAILAWLLQKPVLKAWWHVSVIPAFGRKRQRIRSSRQISDTR